MRRTVILVIGIVLVVGLLAGGAFTAVQLLTPQASAGDEYGPGVMVLEDVIDDGSGNAVTIKTIIEPAPELPDRPAEASGIFLREEDSSYFVGTGNISVNVSVVNGERSVASDHSGPEVEVVVSHDTVFYEDVTDVNFDASESVERRLKQELRQVERPSEMPEGYSIGAFGERRGDRVIADTIVFSDGG